jgi:prepilin-type N-terminal cleavage/methylation domain-containing protein/prepilin-type processing-associated H-X9-DG protein
MRPTITQRRSAFTLIELLVVMAIVGLMVAILLPAVQRSREAARRTHCTNNLKQLGVALASYTAGHGHLPPGYVSVGFDFDLLVSRGPGWGWAAMLLPFVEESALHNDIDFNRDIDHPVNSTTRQTALDLFLCPSDYMPRTWTASSGFVRIRKGRIISVLTPICDVAGSNYVGVYGTSEPGIDGNGVFYCNSSTRPAEIYDGLSQTFAVGERSTNLNNGRGQATWVGSVPGAVFWSCMPLGDGRDEEEEGASGCWREDGSGMTLGHTGEGNGPGNIYADVNQFLSRHGQGAFFLFCDGHVRFLDESMDYKLYRSLSTREGAEVYTGAF